MSLAGPMTSGMQPGGGSPWGNMQGIVQGDSPGSKPWQPMPQQNNFQLSPQAQAMLTQSFLPGLQRILNPLQGGGNWGGGGAQQPGQLPPGPQTYSNPSPISAATMAQMQQDEPGGIAGNPWGPPQGFPGQGQGVQGGFPGQGMPPGLPGFQGWQQANPNSWAQDRQNPTFGQFQMNPMSGGGAGMQMGNALRQANQQRMWGGL